MMPTFFNPNLLNQESDPQGSVRYDNIRIIHFQIPCIEETISSKLYSDQNMFVLCECSPRFKTQRCDQFYGTVLQEMNGSYSWFRSWA